MNVQIGGGRATQQRNKPLSDRHRVGWLLLGLTLPAWSSPPAFAEIGFSLSVIDQKGPSHVWGKGAGDLNGDHRVDLVEGSNDGGLYWYENPTWKRRTISDNVPIEEDMEIIDLDGDGRNDVVSVTTGGITWFKNTGRGWKLANAETGVRPRSARHRGRGSGRRRQA